MEVHDVPREQGTLKDSKIRPEELWPQFTRHLSAALGAAEAGRAGWSPLPQCPDS